MVCMAVAIVVLTAKIDGQEIGSHGTQGKGVQTRHEMQPNVEQFFGMSGIDC